MSKRRENGKFLSKTGKITKNSTFCAPCPQILMFFGYKNASYCGLCMLAPQGIVLGYLKRYLLTKAYENRIIVTYNNLSCIRK